MPQSYSFYVIKYAFLLEKCNIFVQIMQKYKNSVQSFLTHVLFLFLALWTCSYICLTASIWIDWSDCLVCLLACLYLQVDRLVCHMFVGRYEREKIYFVSFVHFSFQITKRPKVKNATCAVCICTSYKEKVDMCLLVCVLVFWLAEWLLARLCTWELKSIANIFWSTLFFWWKKNLGILLLSVILTGIDRPRKLLIGVLSVKQSPCFWGLERMPRSWKPVNELTTSLTHPPSRHLSSSLTPGLTSH